MTSHQGGNTDAAILDQIRELAGQLRDEHTRKIVQNVTGVMQLNPQPLPPAALRAVLEAIALNRRRVLILNTANRSSLPFLDERAVVEVPCLVGAAGARPLAVGPVPDHARALVESVKAVERVTIEAALTGSTALAVKALALHPLVPSVNAARELFDAYRAQLPELQERFA